MATRSRRRDTGDRSNARAERHGSNRRTPTRDLEKSLKGTNQGLTTFLNSLRAAGLEEAVDDYRQLSTVLINQRLWAVDSGRVHLDQQFADIGELAGLIRDVLSPYVSLMGRLEELLTAEQLSQDAKVVTSDLASRGSTARRMLETLFRLGPCSPRRLSDELEVSLSDIKSHAGSLVEEGHLVRRGWGAGQSYRLSRRSQHLALMGLVGGAP